MIEHAEFWQTPSDGRWRYHVKAANGLITEEGAGGDDLGFASSQGCRRAIKRNHPGLPIELMHRVDAWVVGTHEAPEDMPSGLLVNVPDGVVVVHEPGLWWLSTADAFDAEYEWL